ncbi:MAG TPA: type II toxin-antitoxin system VapC family toxin [Gemmataceae bacterium]|nr:type II toxin-antitoxin system VapC family toxin [Gemmataceae bacterium]
MKYVLDTDHISLIQRKQNPEYLAIQSKFALHVSDEIFLSIVSFHEQVLGAHNYLARARTGQELVQGYMLLADALRLFQSQSVLEMNLAATWALDQLLANRVRVKTMDLRIAAITLSIRGILVTRNSRDFSRVPGLVIEDWTR